MTCQSNGRFNVLAAALAIATAAACSSNGDIAVGAADAMSGQDGAPSDAGGSDGPTHPTVSEAGILVAGGCVMPNPAASNLPNPSVYDASIDALVTDQMTGLMWHRAASSSTYTQALAADYCKNSRVGAYADWRLPTVIELVSLVDFTAVSPSIDTLAFPGTSSNLFWTSTPLASRMTNAWYVGFGQGNTNFLDVTVGNFVRCVRAGLNASSSCYQSGARFHVADGLVVDAATGLTWQQGVAPAPLTWSAAKAYCAGLAGSFRLPSLKELQTIVDYGNAHPSPGSAIDAVAFPATPAVGFWTSSVVGGSSTVVWTVKFDNGDTGSSGTTGINSTTNMVELKQARCLR
jgi:hypothetical protein